MLRRRGGAGELSPPRGTVPGSMTAATYPPHTAPRGPKRRVTPQEERARAEP